MARLYSTSILPFRVFLPSFRVFLPSFRVFLFDIHFTFSSVPPFFSGSLERQRKKHTSKSSPLSSMTLWICLAPSSSHGRSGGRCTSHIMCIMHASNNANVNNNNNNNNNDNNIIIIIIVMCIYIYICIHTRIHTISLYLSLSLSLYIYTCRSFAPSRSRGSREVIAPPVGLLLYYSIVCMVLHYIIL